MKFLKYIFPIFSFLTAISCQDELAGLNIEADRSSDKITLDLSLNAAEIKGAQTRAFSDTPDYESLKLYVLEFERQGVNPFDNNLTNDYTASVVDEVKADDGDIHYKITLDKIDQPRVLHLIAVPKDTELNIGFGNEGTVIPGIQLDNSTPAYWNRIEFLDGYGSYDENEVWTNVEDLKEKLTHVPMLCNFSKISLDVAADTGFTLEGYALINRPTKGTVAPWNSTKMTFPDFLNGNTLLPYSTISENYDGYWPYNQVNDVTDKPNANGVISEDLFGTTSIYIYEHPHTSLNSPIIILKGRKNGGSSMYYKLDLGKKDDQQLFQFYNILRNFEYQITITKIDADGYSTAGDAYNGVVFNNFSFDVNTRNMMNVSDGENMLWVNQTTFVVTQADETTVTFKYRYKKDIINNGGTVANGTGEGDDLAFKDLETGEAITGITYGTTDDADGWREITIQTVEPSATRKSQEFIIYDKNTGLGRTIRIIVRNPWSYSNTSLYGVNYDTYAQYQTAVNDYPQWLNTVSSQTADGAQIGGQPLTVGFEIENDIPEAMFPLEFVFEANPQNIENNKVGNLLVQTGRSLFYPTVTSNRIKYVKTVTWLDYNTELTAENSTGAQVTKEDGSVIHFVRGRFLTMNSITGSTNQIRVYNPYMRVRKDDGSYDQYIDFTFGVSNQAGPDLTSNP
ncbi:MAG: hypothetical protein K2L45_02105 [Muribaculaceae bacterium]|nr:hypothetical protein [Muribaculaceae bacterium]